MKVEIKNALTGKGFPAEVADRALAILSEKCCMGAEPTAAMLEHVSIAGMMATGIHEAVAGIIKEVAAGPKPAEKKGRKFKANRNYTAAELVAIYRDDPSAEVIAAIDAHFAKGAPWVVPVGGVAHDKSAQVLEWLRDGQTVPRAINVDGEPVIPVRPGEEKGPRLFYIDPTDPIGFLDAEMTSPTTGARFAGYDDEGLRAFAFLYRHDLNREGHREIRRAADEYRGKTPKEMLAATPAVLALWNDPRTLKMAVKCAKESADPFVQAGREVAPTAGIVLENDSPKAPTKTPTIHVIGVGENQETWLGLEKQFRIGRDSIRFTRDNGSLPGEVTERHRARCLAEGDAFVVLCTSDVIADHDETIGALLRSGKPVLPVVVRPCSLGALKRFGAIPRGRTTSEPTPMSKLDRDSVMIEVADEIRKVAKHVLRPSADSWTRVAGRA